jgi:hypothetical protein
MAKTANSLPHNPQHPVVPRRKDHVTVTLRRGDRFELLYEGVDPPEAVDSREAPARLSLS